MECAIMSNEWVYGEYTGIINLIEEDGTKGPWVLLDAQKTDDHHNCPLVQAGISQEQFDELKEDDDVVFTLTNPDEGDIEAYLIYQEDGFEIDGIYLASLRKAS